MGIHFKVFYVFFYFDLCNKHEHLEDMRALVQVSAVSLTVLRVRTIWLGPIQAFFKTKMDILQTKPNIDGSVSSSFRFSGLLLMLYFKNNSCIS